MITNFMFRTVICRLRVDVGFGFPGDHPGISRLPETAEYLAVKFRAAHI
jgi:hypothetical protein